MLKTHVDIVDDYSPKFVEELKRLASELDFVLWEDRKFADIGATVATQYDGGLFRIADWAPLVNHLTSPHLDLA